MNAHKGLTIVILMLIAPTWMDLTCVRVAMATLETEVFVKVKRQC